MSKAISKNQFSRIIGANSIMQYYLSKGLKVGSKVIHFIDDESDKENVFIVTAIDIDSNQIEFFCRNKTRKISIRVVDLLIEEEEMEFCGVVPDGYTLFWGITEVEFISSFDESGILKAKIKLVANTFDFDDNTYDVDFNHLSLIRKQ